MNRNARRILRSLVVSAAVAAVPAETWGGIPNDEIAASGIERTLDIYISTGDNHYLGAALPVDSPASLAASFDLMKKLGTRRIYWRGLQEATMVGTMNARPENFRYHTAIQWFTHLIEEIRIEPMAVKMAHERGMELWGVGTLADWGCAPDTPGFNDFPWFWESGLRLDNPDWVPVDKYGYRKQGGVIELAYPEARKALVDLHTRLAVDAGYDGVIFLTYAENFSQRFEDEFGYSQPIVEEFKKRFGIDIRHEPFNKYASRTDWYKLRGEYLTMYLRELKQSLNEHGIKLGMFINPRNPRKPGNWVTLHQEHATFGSVYFDLETWVRDEIVDEMAVYGASSVRAQNRSIDDMLWLTRQTNTGVSAVTSSPMAQNRWEPYHEQGVPLIFSHGEDEYYFGQAGFAEQTISALTSGDDWQKMAFLSQIILGTSTAPSASIAPLTEHENVIMRRLSAHALGILGDPAMIPTIERLLDDPESSVRCKAAQALRYNHRPESVRAIFDALAKHGTHPLLEMSVQSLSRSGFSALDEVLRRCDDETDVVRIAAVRVCQYMGLRDEHVPLLTRKLDDPNPYVRYAAAFALGTINTDSAIQALIGATRHTDAAAANRAAVSIQNFVNQGGVIAQKHRADMLAAITAMLARMGDGYTRDDKEWGYRPVGNALLAFGADGEGQLRRWMEQSDDKRLAELAWRVLYIREVKGENQFAIITEAEADAGFRMRPAWMKTARVGRMVNDFESQTFTPEINGNLGTAGNRLGRWGAFARTGPAVTQDAARSGRHSVRLVRGGNALAGYIDSEVIGGNDYEASAWIYREQSNSSLTLSVKGRKPAVADECSVLIDAEGKVFLRNTTEEKWINSGLVVPAQKWMRVVLIVSRAYGNFTVALIDEDGKNSSTEVSCPISEQSEIYRIDLFAQSTEGTSTLVDDVMLEEKP